jgi:hypothetical protein
MELVFGMIKKDRLRDKANGHREIEFLGFVNHSQMLRDWKIYKAIHKEIHYLEEENLKIILMKSF